ncbi:hypothetical protein ADU59_03005 [Pararhizobium polonicum]|uniref:Uncharacterized protein n=1 Tax=Pararhizobium polonicum TaxID=1612624 RepID=A0A1C7P6C1_9HYPH|nr:hypothetical protein [Pararhizobium polonicum]OBZ96727.1 hypothetical protein ADU59_03005 [Pararhizobium polonicum]
MPNASVPAAAEGVPSEIHARNRIRELAYEISSLLDRVPLAAMLTINPAGSNNHPVFLCEYVDEDAAKRRPVPIGEAKGVNNEAISVIMEAEDVFSEAADIAHLVFLAIQSIRMDEENRALSAGVYDIEHRLERGRKMLQEARELLQ